jgi:cell volume regulation protein A
MDPTFPILISVAAVLLLGALGDVLFQRTSMASTLWLVLCGIFLGPLLGLVPREHALVVGPHLAAFTLVVLFSEMQPRLRLKTVTRDLARSGPLAVIAFLASVLLVTLVAGLAHAAGLLPETFTWAHALLLGAILGAPCALLVAPACTRARVSSVTLRTLEQESALATVASILWVAILIAVLDPQAQGLVNTSLHLLATLLLGAGIGLLGAVVWVGFLHLLQAPHYAHVTTLAFSLVLYAIAMQTGASGIVALLVFTIALANARELVARSRLSLRFDTTSDPLRHRPWSGFLVQSAFFLFAGLMVGPPWDLLVLGLLLALLLVPPRLPAVLVAFRALSPQGGKADPAERSTAAVAMPRGMLAGALSLLPAQAAILGAEALPIAAFTVVAVSMVAFAIALVLVRRPGRAQVVALDADEQVQASVSIVPDEVSRRALLESVDDASPPTTRSPDARPSATGQAPVSRPLPPPVPPPRRKDG